MSRAILYRHASRSSLLLDLPATIEDAQAIPNVQILSIAPLQIPYITPEPKGTKRDVLLAQIPAFERQYHEDLSNEVVAALNAIQPCISSGASWCLPRWSVNVVTFDSLPKCDKLSPATLNPPVVLSPIENCFTSSLPLRNAVFINANQNATLLRDLDSSVSFLIPAESKFLWASITDGLRTFEELMQCRTSACNKTLDLILLDPPWANRSVRNSRVYRTTEDQLGDPFDQALPIIVQYLAQDGLVATWVTNKIAIRAKVTESLQSLGLVLFEEWVWVKVTNKGEPVTRLDGIWRKPYEMLLLYRRKEVDTEVKRRLIFAVPDFHSRKPNLKRLFEEFLPTSYSALELFARSLTSGWLAWGDEVLKFQDERYWRRINDT